MVHSRIILGAKEYEALSVPGSPRQYSFTPPRVEMNLVTYIKGSLYHTFDLLIPRVPEEDTLNDTDPEGPMRELTCLS